MKTLFSLLIGLLIVGSLNSIYYTTPTNNYDLINNSPNLQAIFPESDTESIVNATPPLFDAVILFSPNASQFFRDFNLTRNKFYQICYQAYIPFTHFNASLNLTDPYGNQYRLIQTQENLTTNYTMKYYRYLCNENGFHHFELDVQTNISLSFYLLFQELENMTQFIRSNTLIPSKVLMVEAHSETFLINMAKKTQTYYFPLIPDIEYRMVYFRGVGIPVSIANEINYTNPTVKIEMWYGGHYFLLAPNFTTLNAFEVGGQFDAIRFAVWKYDVAQIKISTNATLLNLNYGFSVYSIKEIGDGPEAYPFVDLPPNNTTIDNTTESLTNNTNTNTTSHPTNLSATGIMDQIFKSMDSGMQQYGDKIILTAFVGIGAILGIPYMKRLKGVKTITPKEIRQK